jgi:alkylhydroperoxidase family enzyme
VELLVGGESVVSRVPPVNPEDTEAAVREILARQAERWGAPLTPTLVLAHCPPLVAAAAGLSAALERSAQLPPALRDLVCLRVAQLIGCPF